MTRVRTRYAPSPTGFLHIGGARSALFNYLYAKHMKGDFIFRTEDTDAARNVKGGEASQIDNLIWLGIEPDESPLKPNANYGPYRQSEKLARYQFIADQLVQTNKAYKAYDTTEELTQQRQAQEAQGQYSFRYDRNWLKLTPEEIKTRDTAKQYTIRLSLKQNHTYEWNDLVRGPVSVNTNDIGDWVIVKQDGVPTYNFAVVVDDHDMAISHVLRGEEHLTNTPKQLAVYEALDWVAPTFGHLTLITDMTGKKLSKRDTELKSFVEDYKVAGYLPEALFNFLALLGWTHAKSIEVLTQSQLIRDFDLARLSKAPSKFDEQKLTWFANTYFKALPNEEIKKHLKLPSENRTWIELFISTYKPSVASYSEMQAAANLFTNVKVKRLKHPPVVNVFAKNLANLSFTDENIKRAIVLTRDETKLSGKDLFMPIRLATTYQESGPELSKAIYLTGEALVKERLNN